MNALSLKTLLLVLAILLFLVAVIDDNNGGDWIAIGLAVMAAALLVSEAGWGRNIGGRNT